MPRRTDETEQVTDEQSLAIVKEGEAGRKVADVCRPHGITGQTYCRWKAEFGGMELSEMQRLKQVEDENRGLKQIVAEQSLDLRRSRRWSEKQVGPAARRDAVGWLVADQGANLRRVVGLSTATWHYVAHARVDKGPLRDRLCALAVVESWFSACGCVATTRGGTSLSSTTCLSLDRSSPLEADTFSGMRT